MKIDNHQTPTALSPQDAKINPNADCAIKVLSTAEIQAWIVTYLADLLEVDSDEINPAIPFDCYGLDSSVAIGLTGDLEDWIGYPLDPTLLYDYPSVEKLARHLSEELKSTHPG